jgi:hypothetical protein
MTSTGMLGWYDFFIYGTAAAVVFGPQFFPQVSGVAGTLAAFATFAVGFVARPLGGIVMGHYVSSRRSRSAPDQFTAWAWRIPFLASGVLVGVGLWVVRKGVLLSQTSSRS